MQKSFSEMIKEGLRLALLGAGSFFITYLFDQLKLMDQTSSTVMVTTFVLRIADKFIYQYQKQTFVSMPIYKGLTGV